MRQNTTKEDNRIKEWLAVNNLGVLKHYDSLSKGRIEVIDLGTKETVGEIEINRQNVSQFRTIEGNLEALKRATGYA